MEYLTKKQRMILNYIKRYVDRTNCWPTVREIATHFNLSSPATVQQHITNLTKKGYLKKNERSYSIVD